MPLLAMSLGSNIDAHRNLRQAIALLRAQWPDLQLSTVYESEAVGFSGDNFLNLVAVAETDLPLADILATLKAIEDQLGRDRSQPRFSPRSMDIDILIYGDDNGDSCEIRLPRPEITRNAYVLKPLAELLPDAVHKPTKKSFAELWQEFDESVQPLWPISLD